MNPITPPFLFDTLQKHSQRHQSSCQASALEFVSKLYGLIPQDSFPLQENPENQNKGFADKDLLTAVYLSDEEGYYDIQSALDLIEKETNSGKILSISLANILIDPVPRLVGYHIYVLVSLFGRPILIDPATKRVLDLTKEDLAKVLELNSGLNPERTTINIQILTPSQQK